MNVTEFLFAMVEFLQISNIVALSTLIFLLFWNSYRALDMHVVNDEEDDIDGDFHRFNKFDPFQVGP